MAEKSMFFDSTDNDERLYSSADFAQFMKLFYSTGVVNGGDGLKVVKSGEKLAVSVLPGKAVVEGRPYWLTEAAKELAVPAASTSFARIDRVVLRLDLTVEKRTITAQVLQGEATASPRPPALLRNNNCYDISLAQLYIPANALQVEAVTDERYNAELCGICQGLYTLDMSDFGDLDAFMGPFTEHVENTGIHVTATNKTAWNNKLDKTATAVAATKLATGRAINGVPFDGTKDISINGGNAASVNHFTFAVASAAPSSAPAGQITFVYEI